MTIQPWGREPRIGDIWVGEDDAGEPIFRSVTAVEPPVTDPTDSRFPCDWQVSLDGNGPAHRGWWHGQGWEEVEEG